MLAVHFVSLTRSRIWHPGDQVHIAPAASQVFLLESRNVLYLPAIPKRATSETKPWSTSHFHSFWIVSKGEQKSLEATILFYFLLLIMPWKSPGQGLWHLLVFYHMWSSLAWMQKVVAQWPGDNGGWMTIYRSSGCSCHGGKWKNKRLILKIRLRPNLKETHTENFLSFWWVKTKPWNMIRER